MRRFSQLLESAEMLNAISFEETDIDTVNNGISKFPEKYNLVNDAIGELDDEDAFKNSLLMYNFNVEEKSNTGLFKIILNKKYVVGYFSLGLMQAEYTEFTADFYNIIFKHLNYFKEIDKAIKSKKSKIYNIDEYINEINKNSSHNLKFPILSENEKDGLINFYNNILRYNCLDKLLLGTPYISSLCINGDEVRKIAGNNFSSFDFIKSVFAKIIKHINYNNFKHTFNYSNFPVISNQLNDSIIINKLKIKITINNMYFPSPNNDEFDYFTSFDKNNIVKNLFNSKYNGYLMEIFTNIWIDDFNNIFSSIKIPDKIPFVTVHPKNERIEKMYIRGGFELIPNDKQRTLIYFL